jgi:hypothetical protein
LQGGHFRRLKCYLFFESAIGNRKSAIQKMAQCLWLIPLGFGVGALGTLIGAGGGFILVPVLLLAYPGWSPELVTSISLVVVFFNALSGACAYARMKRIDYRSGLLFAAATIPGAVLGALSTAHIERRSFNGIFGVVLFAIAVFLLVRPQRRTMTEGDSPGDGKSIRTLVDADGNRHSFVYRPVLGVVLSLFVGYVSSLLGIGGGIIHVPALVHLLRFPTHIATATSHFILAFTAFGGAAVHVARGVFSHGASATICLAAGALVGAQVGARASCRIRGAWIIRCLALALGSVGIRIFLMAF